MSPSRLVLALLVAIPGLAWAKPRVVASFSIPADWAARTGGEAVSVISLTPPRSDLHAVQPTPAQAKTVASADLVVGIHPQLETWLAKLEATGDLRRPVLWLGKPVLGEQVGRCCDNPHHRHRGPLPKMTAETDPHVWMDPDLAAGAVKQLGEELAKLDEAAAPGIRSRTAAYAGTLSALTAELRATLASVPADRRKLVTHHDNLRRFAKKFDFTVAGTLIGGGSTETSDPSARQIAATLDLIKKEKIPAVFADGTLAGRLPETVAREAGLPAPTVLTLDSLDRPGTAADSYAGLMRETARKIAGALAPAPASRP